MKVSVIIPVWNQELLLKRAVKSIPKRNDIEVIVINDGSTDNTSAVIRELDVVSLEYKDNKGVSYALNRGLEMATGEYITILGSDDYFYTDKFLEVMEYLNGADIIYYDMIDNNDFRYRANPDSARKEYCGSVKFMRRKFIEGIRNREDLVDSEDWYFFQEILERKPIETTTGIVAKHYNFPRVGSLSWNRGNGWIPRKIFRTYQE